MTGTKLYKQNLHHTAYGKAAEWCNHNNATIEDKGEYYEVVALPEPSPPSVEEQKKIYENAVQAHLDATAQTRGYDNTYTCLSYTTSKDETWLRESLAFSEWRDSVWRKAHEILNAYMAGEIAQPTVEEVIAQLPPVDWNDPE
jgi:hypothetical protein